MTDCLRQTFAVPPHRQDRAHIGRLIKPPAFSEADVHQKRVLAGLGGGKRFVGAA
jgi:hypothetical protein